MSGRPSHRAWLSLVLVVLLPACMEEPFPLPDEETVLRAIAPLGAPAVDATNSLMGDSRAQALGLALYHDASLSSCGTLSCKSCHEPDQGYTFNGAAGAPGCNGQPTGRNPPTLLNSGHSRWFMWDGRADRMWSQAALPFLSPDEMDGSPTVLRQKLAAEPYVTQYQELFGQTAEQHSEDQVLVNFGKALQAYEWTLTRGQSPFDRQLATYLAAVDEGTAEDHPLHLGLKTFVRKGGCAVCHKGATLSDEDFHNIGLADASAGRTGRLAGAETVLASPFNALGGFSDQTTGPAANRLHNLRLKLENPTERAALEANGQLTGAFKTPSLRNIALTGPYMHTGTLPTLAEVVDFYDRGGDPDGSFAGTRAPTIQTLNLTAEEKAALVELLELMTGDPL